MLNKIINWQKYSQNTTILLQNGKNTVKTQLYYYKMATLQLKHNYIVTKWQKYGQNTTILLQNGKITVKTQLYCYKMAKLQSKHNDIVTK